MFYKMLFCLFICFFIQNSYAFDDLQQLLNEATQDKENGKYLKAIEKLELGLKKARNISHLQAISSFLGNLGIIYDHINETEKAIDFYQQALEVNQTLNDPVGICRDLINLGVAYNNLKQYRKALKYYEQALDIQKELNNPKAIADIYTNIGSAYSNLGEYAQALHYFQQALVIHKEIGDHYSENADVNNIAVIKSRMGESSSTSTILKASLDYCRKNKDLRCEAETLINLGTSYLRLDQHLKAMDFFQNSLKICEKIGYRACVVTNLSNLGVIYDFFGEYKKALQHQKEALKINHEIKNPEGKATAMTNLAIVYSELGQHQKALDLYQQAIAIFRKIENSQGISRAIGNMCSTYLQLGQAEQALDCYQEAIDKYEKITDYVGGIGVFMNIGVALHTVGKYEQAQVFYQQARNFCQTINDRRCEGIAFANIGLAQTKLGQYTQAQETLTQAKTIFQMLNNQKGLLFTKRGQAINQAQQKQGRNAIKYYLEALDSIETMRGKLTDKKLKISIFQSQYYIYDEFIQLLYELSQHYSSNIYAQQTLEIFERKQGRIFVEEMGESGARNYFGVPKKLIEQEIRLKTQFNEVNIQLVQEHAKSISKQDKAYIDNLELKHHKLEKQEKALQKHFHTQYPDYYALRHPQPVTLQQLQKSVLKRNEVMLVYNVMPKILVSEVNDSIILWFINKEKYEVFKLSITPKELSNRITAFHHALANRGQMILKHRGHVRGRNLIMPPEEVESIDVAAHGLYQDLIPASVRPLLKNKTLYVVPTKILYRLPFEALVMQPGKKPHYLLEDTAISYLSSASLLKIIRDAHSRRKDEPSFPFLAFANPLYEKINPESVDLTKSMLNEQFQLTGLSSLPETEIEARDISQIFGFSKKNSVNALQLKENASRSQLLNLNKKQILDDYRYLLFATHGVFTQIDKLTQPALALSYPQKDGYLTMTDIFGLKLNADFIMLSACNTGSGDPAGVGEGIRGLTGAFMYAGTPAIAVTLWSVETHSAKALSTEIFRQLHTGQPIAKAIQTAKLKMLRGELRGAKKQQWQHPFYWAPFVGFGDGSIQHAFYNRNNPFLIVALLREVGYYDKPLEQTNWNRLKEPLFKLQADLGLPTSGKLDDATWDKLRTVKLKPEVLSKVEALFLARHSPVYIAKLLIEVGYYNEAPDKASWDTLHEPLKALQKDLGLPQTGKMNEAVWIKLQQVK